MESATELESVSFSDKLFYIVKRRDARSLSRGLQSDGCVVNTALLVEDNLVKLVRGPAPSN